MNLRKEMEKLSQLFPKKTRFKYNSYVDLILSEGTEFTKIYPHKSELMNPKSCYYNCYTVALIDPEVFYCEGYAMPKDIQIAFEHAWLINKNFEVIEVTWDFSEVEYYGVAFKSDWLQDFIEQRKEENYSIFGGNYLEKMNLLNGLPNDAVVKLKTFFSDN